MAQVRPDSCSPARAARASSTFFWNPRAPLERVGVKVILKAVSTSLSSEATLTAGSFSGPSLREFASALCRGDRRSG